MICPVDASACAHATPGQGAALLLRRARFICRFRSGLRGRFDRGLLRPGRSISHCRRACGTYRRVCGLWIVRWLWLDGSRNAARREIPGRGSKKHRRVFTISRIPRVSAVVFFQSTQPSGSCVAFAWPVRETGLRLAKRDKRFSDSFCALGLIGAALGAARLRDAMTHRERRSFETRSRVPF